MRFIKSFGVSFSSGFKKVPLLETENACACR